LVEYIGLGYVPTSLLYAPGRLEENSVERSKVEYRVNKDRVGRAVAGTG